MVMAAAVLAAFLAASWWLTGSAWGLFTPSDGRAHVTVGQQRVPVPEPAENPTRLLPAVVVPDAGSYAFSYTSGGEPVFFDPCVPVRWKLSTADMPRGAEEMVRQAVDDISARTGLSWEFAGYTGSPPDQFAPLVELVDGEWAWAPVVIGWSDAARTSALQGSSTGAAAGIMGPSARDDGLFLRAGVVFIDIDDLPQSFDRAEDRDRTLLILTHELGHVVGLDHVTDSGELMYPLLNGATGWGPGDLAGLAAAGSGRCEGT